MSVKATSSVRSICIRKRPK